MVHVVITSVVAPIIRFDPFLHHFVVSKNSIGGALYVPFYMRRTSVDHFRFFAGELPKELFKLTNLTTLALNDNEFRGKLYVPA